MTSPQFSNFFTPLRPLVTLVKPWKSPQFAIFCTPLPPTLLRIQIESKLKYAILNLVPYELAP